MTPEQEERALHDIFAEMDDEFYKRGKILNEMLKSLGCVKDKLKYIKIDETCKEQRRFKSCLYKCFGIAVEMTNVLYKGGNLRDSDYV